MTPYELAKLIHMELSPVAPRLSAAINRALVDIGEGSVLVGLGPGTNENDDVSFQESESINARAGETDGVLAKIHEMMWKLEEHSSWKVIIDKKPGYRSNRLELLYTLIRTKGDL
ncbi:hypothetical protein DSCA_46480 [Desulfosarcina alkanivorans]|jgi:hypothetical protein|uniref:Uncharacterized protein n=1 Tax=Desulfosarcina alkanivorans TaxID=571177 RepID=A0A5K7YPS7_9BACT|nr:hypothetical protein [Desulfosarcina alkanivorans]BBO70718.1 hypothetical protein DSCA_46480 [Desulfosarcina alkanivorans]